MQEKMVRAAEIELAWTCAQDMWVAAAQHPDLVARHGIEPDPLAGTPPLIINSATQVPHPNASLQGGISAASGFVRPVGIDTGNEKAR